MNWRLLFCFCVILVLSGCSGCSKSGRLKPKIGDSPVVTPSISPPKREKVVIKMEKQGGVYHIPIKINGIEMYFIFDTGASTISISETEANSLRAQGKLDDNDIKGTASFSDANGDISEGTVIVLKTVQIGNRILYNVEASVVHNLNAPLLFGQSALERFGNISIDNNKREITFE